MRILLLAATLLACVSLEPAQAAPPVRVPHLRAADTPLAFEINRGQVDARAHYLARANGIDLYLTEDGALLSMRELSPLPAATHAPRVESPWQLDYLATSDMSAALSGSQQALALRYRFADANPHPRIEGLDALPGHSNYLLGNHPQQWRTDIPTYRRVRYHDVYPGVDVVYYGDEGRLEFDVEVAPGADLAQVRLQVDGAEALALNDAGDLRVRTALGELVQHKAVVYQMVTGERRELRGGYVLRDSAREVAFNVPDYDHRVALVLDPTLVWTEQVGGSGTDTSYGVAADSSGNWYFTGFSDFAATNFPTTVGAYQTGNNGSSDAFVRKLSNDGATVLYSTLIGGSGIDVAHGIGVDASGNAYIAGTTYSSNFPTHNAFQSTNPSGANVAGFVASLNAAGNGLNYATYLGGTTGFSIGTSIYGLAVDSAGNAFVTGDTTTDNLPTTATAFQPAPKTTGNHSAFVFEFGPSGSRIFGTYIVDDYLGFGGDYGVALALDDRENVYVAGYTNSNFGGDYNAVAAAQIGPGGGSYDILVARLSHTGQWLDWVTHVGGSAIDKGTAIAVDLGHQVLVTGWSASSDLPPAFTNLDDWAWIGQLDETGTQLMDSTFVGAAGAATFPEAIVWNGPNVVLVGQAQKPSAISALNAIAGLDCGAACGGNSSYGGVLATLTTGPFALQSLTRAFGATGTGTRFWGAAQDPHSATGRTAFAGNADGNFPLSISAISGRTSPNAPTSVGPSAADGAVDTHSSGPLPPIVEKYFEPATVEPGQHAFLHIKVLNPNPTTPISSFLLNDLLPPCVTLDVSYQGPSFASSALGDSEFRIRVNIPPSTYEAFLAPGSVISPYQSVDLIVPVKAGAANPDCLNVTQPITTDLGTVPPAEASLVIAPNTCKEVSSATCTDMGSASCWNSNVVPANACDAEITPCTGPCTVDAGLPADEKLAELIVDGDTTITGNGGSLYLGRGLTVANGANVTVTAPVSSVDDALTITVDGRLQFTNKVTLPADTDFGLDITGLVDFVDVVEGGADVTLVKGEADFDVAPTITGDFNVAGGILVGNVFSQPVTVYGAGTLRGCSSCADIEVLPGGDFHPCVGTSPCTSNIDSLNCDGGKIELDCSVNNTTCTAINVSGPVDSDCNEVDMHFLTPPPLGATFGSITGSSNTGCPGESHSTPPTILLAPQCTATVVSLVVEAVDDVFHSAFGG